MAFLKKKNICEIKSFDLLYHLVYFLMFCAYCIFQSWCWKYLSTFLSNFISFIKRPYFCIFILVLSPKWLLDAFNIHVIYFEQKSFISFYFFWIFLLILKNIQNSSIFRSVLVYIFFQFFNNNIDCWIMVAFWYYF